jgi:colanic acid biosynthesis glycosyl transferase WcaI
MRILICGINYAPELTGIGKYTGEMGSWLAANGHEVVMITGMPYYPDWKIDPRYKGRWWFKEVVNNVTVYRCPMYIPSSPSGLKRMIHEASFFLSAFFVFFVMLFKKKFDTVIAIAPPFHLGFLALFYRFFKSTNIIYHIQDLQIEAAKELDMLKSKVLFTLLFKMEHFILTRANRVSTIAEGMKNKIIAKTKNPVYIVPNWVDIDFFSPLSDRNQEKIKWGYQSDDQIVLYSGSMGEKQGLDVLIRIASTMREVTKVKFIICGNGPFKEELIRMASSQHLENIKFLPLQSYDVFNSFLNIADIHLILQKANASDLVLPSKLTTILAVGGLVLATANPGTTLYETIKRHDMGFVIEAENEELLIGAINEIITTDYGYMRSNAREYAEKFLNMHEIISKMISK